MKQNSNLKESLFLLMMFLFLFIPINLFAQTYQLKGTVYDLYREPLVGANVLVKGTSERTITDVNGEFILQVRSGGILEVSFIGYEKQELSLNGQSSVKIILKEDHQMLEETILIGYGTMKKSDMTGAISSVDVDALASRATTNPAEALQVRIAGVNILKSGGNAGAGVNVKIRGIKSMGGNDPHH